MSGTGFGFGLARQVAVKDRAHGADTWIEWRVGTILIYKSLTCWGPFSFHILIHFVSLLLLTSFYKLTLQLATKPQPDSDPIRFSRILSTASSDSQIHSLLLSSLEIRAKHGIRISVSIALSSPGSYFLLLLIVIVIIFFSYCSVLFFLACVLLFGMENNVFVMAAKSSTSVVQCMRVVLLKKNAFGKIVMLLYVITICF